MASGADSSSLEVTITGDRAVIRMPNSHFGMAEHQLDDEHFLALLLEVEQTQLDLDFSNVKFLTSLGLAMLLRLRRQLADTCRRLAILNLQPHVHEIFSVTCLNTILDVYPPEAA
jgi:anti-anti-sigma factor